MGWVDDLLYKYRKIRNGTAVMPARAHFKFINAVSIADNPTDDTTEITLPTGSASPSGTQYAISLVSAAISPGDSVIFASGSSTDVVRAVPSTTLTAGFVVGLVQDFGTPGGSIVAYGPGAVLPASAFSDLTGSGASWLQMGATGRAARTVLTGGEIRLGSVNPDGTVTVDTQVPKQTAASHTWNVKSFGGLCDNIHADDVAFEAMVTAWRASGQKAMKYEHQGMSFLGATHTISWPFVSDCHGGGTQGGGLGTTPASGWRFAPLRGFRLVTPVLVGGSTTAAGSRICNVDFRTVKAEQAVSGFVAGVEGAMGDTRSTSRYYDVGECVQVSANAECFFRIKVPGTPVGSTPAAFTTTTTPGVDVVDGALTWTSEAFIKGPWTAGQVIDMAGRRRYILGDPRFFLESLGAGTCGALLPEQVYQRHPSIEGTYSVIWDGGVYWKVLCASLIQSAAQCVVSDFTCNGSSGYAVHIQSSWNKQAPAFMTGNPNITINVAAKTITRDAGSFVSDGFVNGMVIGITDADNNGNNNSFTISTVTALVITLTASTGMVNEGPHQWFTIEATTSLSGGDFSRVGSHDIQGCNGAIYIHGGDTNGFVCEGRGSVILNGYGRAHYNALIGSGPIGYMDLSLGGGKWAGTYLQTSEGVGYFMNPLSSQCTMRNPGDELAYEGMAYNTLVLGTGTQQMHGIKVGTAGALRRNPNLTFTNSGSADTITRDDTASGGSFVKDGFAAQDVCVISGTASNNITTGPIATVTAGTITFGSATSLTNEGPVSGVSLRNTNVPAGNYRPAQVTREKFAGTQVVANASRNVACQDGTGTNLMYVGLAPQDGKTFYQERYALEGAFTVRTMSDFISGYPVGWHLEGYNYNSLQQHIAKAGPNALWPSGAAIAVGEFLTWIISGRLCIGVYTSDPASLEFGTATPTANRHVSGSFSFHKNPGDDKPDWWVNTVAGSPGTWKPGPWKLVTGNNGANYYTLVEAADPSGAATRRVVALARTAALTATQMPANSGDGVVYIAQAQTAPTANPVGGFTIFVDPADGALKARGPGGTVTTMAVS